MRVAASPLSKFAESVERVDELSVPVQISYIGVAALGHDDAIIVHGAIFAT